MRALGAPCKRLEEDVNICGVSPVGGISGRRGVLVSGKLGAVIFTPNFCRFEVAEVSSRLSIWTGQERGGIDIYVWRPRSSSKGRSKGVQGEPPSSPLPSIFSMACSRTSLGATAVCEVKPLAAGGSGYLGCGGDEDTKERSSTRTSDFVIFQERKRSSPGLGSGVCGNAID